MISEKKILCTRPAEDCGVFKQILEKAGAEVINTPLIEIHLVSDTGPLDEKLDSINNYYGLIFTSSNGVRFFFERAEAGNINIKSKIFCVGEKTASAAELHGYNVAAVPENFDSRTLTGLLKSSSPVNARFLFIRGNISMKDTIMNLNNTDDVIVYETRKPVKNNLLINAENMLSQNQIDCIAFFSPSAVSNFTELFENYKTFDTDFAVIGKTTLQRIAEKGLKAAIIANKPTAECLADEIVNYYNAG